MLNRRILLTSAALVPLAGLAASRTAEATGSGVPVPIRLPRPTGPFPVGTTELHLVDAGRDDPFVPGRPRELMISVWYPASRLTAPASYLPPLTAEVFGEGAAIALQQPVGTIDWAGAKSHAGLLAPVCPGKRPVVLFSPGFGVPRGLASISVAELASRGYVVVTVDHTYEVSGVEFPGNRIEVQTLPPAPYAMLARTTRFADLRFVLDSLTRLARGENPDAEQRRLPNDLGNVFDLDRIGSYGHSAGGLSSIDLLVADPRIRAAIDLDGELGYGYDDPADAPTVAKGTNRPFLLMGSGAIGPGPHDHRTDPSWGLFWEHSSGWKRDLNLPNGRHYSFVDYQALIPWFQRFFTVPPELIANTVGTANADQVLRAMRTYIPAFFDQHLRYRPHNWSHALPETRFIA
ncbi:platelet-activating factor acetylhydrolase isoform II [Kribbella sp. VKM Ac-2569]|uniref:alpha/beta hydrolase family protein n=1 Tax=Kribbella sp. VKM Ac-2569 TaxID=2512220 RepID=UPI00102C9302|nr:lipase [Kribbella sp. VKM Ac-2569]RZT15264.1 platelet-activating factor acetylhydrolase isoform II [Kribbella sp. VKM Ac-2569]